MLNEQIVKNFDLKLPDSMLEEIAGVSISGPWIHTNNNSHVTEIPKNSTSPWATI